LGAILEWLRAGSKKGKGREQQRKDGCEWVRVTVDSYRFNDKVGKDADPDAMFAPRPPVWNARVEPDSFAFAPGEAYREVELIVDAPDFPGPDEAFNVTAWQGGEPSGGVTVTIHPGGGN
ncbi:MAG TPA: hypothetical protein VNI20_11975, partial [Fimbriimonadaceae bacterium]|nr:hypothetical protein [Fimbriimonadaceae bacterium]